MLTKFPRKEDNLSSLIVLFSFSCSGGIRGSYILHLESSEGGKGEGIQREDKKRTKRNRIVDRY